jgi:MFS family permease
MQFFKLELDPRERRTFRLHTLYSLIEGVILGVLALNEFVFLRTLKGSNFQVGLLFQASVFVLVFSIFLNEWLNRVKNKHRFVLITTIITRAPLLLLFFFPEHIGTMTSNAVWHYLFLGIFLTYYFANPIIYPVINLFLKANYTYDHFSVLYSYSTSLNKIVMLVVTFAYGLLLDYNDQTYRYVFPVMGILAILSVYIFTRIHYKVPPESLVTTPFRKSIGESITKMRQILKGNRPFRDFESAFMFYGFAFMGTVSVITIFYESELHLNYSSVAFYKNSYNLVAIFLLPFMGRLMGRIAPRKFAAITFASLLFYLAFIMFTQYFPWKVEIKGIQVYFCLFISMLFNGVFAATMSLLWSIGSAYFCKKEEAADYQAIHLTFTGVRSFFAPLLGVWVYEILGFTGTFLLGIVLLAVAVWISLRPQEGEIND